MIEIIQENGKTEDKFEGKLPKNIRQIGNPEKDFRIYMEDYVYTYLHPAKQPEDTRQYFPRLLILLGEVEHFSNRSCAFISGAVSVENGQFSEKLLELGDDFWHAVRGEIRQYFPKSEIIGWVLDLAGQHFGITENIEKIHKKNFAGKYQFLFLMDSIERDEAFYVWKQGQLTKKEGYFIYYEKNPQMQEYMVSQKEAEYGEILQEENVSDIAARNYRAMMLEKKGHVVKNRWGFATYAAYALLILSLCTVSVVLLGSIEKVEHMENAISMLSMSMDSTEPEKRPEDNQVAVETISSNVLPIDDAAAEGQGDAADVQEPVQQDEAANGAVQQEEPQSNPENQENPENQPNAENQPGTMDQDAADKQKEAEASAASSESVPQQQEEKSDVEKWREQGFYIVQTGDSLEQISYKIYQTYAMTKKLCEANGISDENNILAGQKLLLP